MKWPWKNCIYCTMLMNRWIVCMVHVTLRKLICEWLPSRFTITIEKDIPKTIFHTLMVINGFLIMLYWSMAPPLFRKKLWMRQTWKDHSLIFSYKRCNFFRRSITNTYMTFDYWFCIPIDLSNGESEALVDSL